MVSKSSVKKSMNVKTEQKSIKKFILIAAGIIVLALIILLFVYVFNAKKADMGDTVTVDYTGYFENGSVFDTSLEDVGLQAGLDKQSYEPITFAIGDGSIITGFEENINGMGVGSKKTFTLTPEEAYGEFDERRVARGLKRSLNVTRYSVISLEVYNNLFDEAPTVDQILNRPDIPWNLKIVEVNDTSVKIENELSVGQSIEISGVSWDSVVVNINNETIYLRQNPEVDDYVAFPTQQGVEKGIVNRVDADTFDVDTNHPLAGKTLVFDVEIKDIQKTA